MTFSDSLVCYSRPSLDDQMANLNFVMQEQGCFETHKGLCNLLSHIFKVRIRTHFNQHSNLFVKHLSLTDTSFFFRVGREARYSRTSESVGLRLGQELRVGTEHGVAQDREHRRKNSHVRLV